MKAKSAMGVQSRTRAAAGGLTKKKGVPAPAKRLRFKRGSGAAIRTKSGKQSDVTGWLKEVPAAQRTAAKELSELMKSITRESDPMDAGNLLIQIFESHVAAGPQPMPRAGMAVALLRGRVAREEIKQEEGGSISSSQAAERLGISKTAVLKRYNLAQLVGWKEAKQGAVRMPAWQFTEDNVLQGIPETLAVLNQASWMDDWARILFFLNRRASLDGNRPLDLLRKGRKEPVLQAAMAAIE